MGIKVDKFYFVLDTIDNGILFEPVSELELYKRRDSARAELSGIRLLDLELNSARMVIISNREFNSDTTAKTIAERCRIVIEKRLGIKI